MATLYNEFFDIDQNYFPQINDSSIIKGEKTNPDFWMQTYPHDTFINMLKSFEQILSRKDKRTLSIEGPYGSGKSQCAYALRRILDVPEEKLLDYWNRYDSLKKRTDLYSKYIGHKNNKRIITAYRYGSGDVASPRVLFSIIQDTLIKEFTKSGISCACTNSWRQAAIAWLSEEANKQVFEVYLKTKYSSRFSQKTADEVLKELNSGNDINELMSNLFAMGEAQGIDMFSFDDDSFVEWVREVFKENQDLCVVFIWDEFGDFFRNNLRNLSSYQKLLELAGDLNFYFIGVTHDLEQEITNSGRDKSQRKLLDRISRCTIDLPDNTAFVLIGEATTVKQSTKDIWNEFAADLNGRVEKARSQVAKIASISDPNVIQKIMPIHPMTALVLKYIANAFKSNQRSMFDFIKSENSEVHAFQWYISKYGPTSDSPYLTIDLLWSFFYEHGRSNLAVEIQEMLDAYGLYEDKIESPDEERVFKTILILNAIDKRLSGSFKGGAGALRNAFKATDENLRLAFEGIKSLDKSKAPNLAKGMVKKNILLVDGKDKDTFYRTASLAGKVTPIELPQTSTLINDGGISEVFSLPMSLKMRYEVENGFNGLKVVGPDDFRKSLDDLNDSEYLSWEMKAIVCVASSTEEAEKFQRELLLVKQKKDYENIVIIDATSTTLTEAQIQEYCLEGGYANYYSGKDPKEALRRNNNMNGILTDWRSEIAKGSLCIYYQGELKHVEGKNIHSILQSFVTDKYNYVFEFTPGLTDNMIKATQCNASVKCGTKRGTPGIDPSDEKTKITSGPIAGIEKKLFPTDKGKPNIWYSDKYWQVYPNEPISKIKIALDQRINHAFEESGCISISDIYDWLEKEYGFAKSNLYSFITGYLLADYANDASLRYADSNNAQEEMEPNKLADAIGSYIAGKAKLEVRIVKQSQEERNFYLLTQKVWGAQKTATTPALAMSAIQTFLLQRELPLRFVESQVSPETYGILAKFVDFCQKSGAQQMDVLLEIGKIAGQNLDLANSLSEAMEEENFQNGTLAYLQKFNSGNLWKLKEEIGTDSILADVKQKFSTVKYQFLWNEETQDDQISLLETEYEFAALTGQILNLEVRKESNAYEAWRDTTKNLRVSYETVVKERPELSQFVVYWRKMLTSRFLPEQLSEVTKEMRAQSQTLFDLFYGVGDFEMFKKAFQPILNEDIPDDYIREIYDSQECQNMFGRSLVESNKIVSQVWHNLSSQIWGKKLEKLWREKTGSESPREWSRNKQTPILCLIPEEEFDKLRQALETVENWKNRSDDEIKGVYEYLSDSPFFETLDNEEELDAAFVRSFYKDNKLYLKFIPVDTAREAFSRCVAEPYDWFSNPMIASEMKRLMNEAYERQGKSLALDKVKVMPTEKLQEYVVRLIEEKPAVGMEILASEEE